MRTCFVHNPSKGIGLSPYLLLKHLWQIIEEIVKAVSVQPAWTHAFSQESVGLHRLQHSLYGVVHPCPNKSIECNRIEGSLHETANLMSLQEILQVWCISCQFEVEQSSISPLNTTETCLTIPLVTTTP